MKNLNEVYSDDDFFEQEEISVKVDRKKRTAKMILILLILMLVILAICTVWLIYSLFFSSSTSSSVYEEILCAQSDYDCITKLCPQGTRWDLDQGQCLVLHQFICCTDFHSIFKCFPPSKSKEAEGCLKLTYEGVLYPGYKQYCRQGWLWVPWKKKCHRKNLSS